MMALKDIFKRASGRVNSEDTMKAIGAVAKVEFNDNRVFVGLKIPAGGLTKQKATSKERRAMFMKMLEKLYSLGVNDLELDEALADADFPVSSVFVPIDLPKHANNRDIIRKMLPYTDFMTHSHNKYPRDWQR